ncbi:hypothetical protein [Microcystis phage Mel-JY01]
MGKPSNIMETVVRTVQKEIAKEKIKNQSRELYEAVRTYDKAIQTGTDARKRRQVIESVAKKEKQLYETFREHISPCDCGDDTGEMLRGQILSILDISEKIFHMIENTDTIEPWAVRKITLAEDYLRGVYSYLSYHNSGEMVDPEEWDDDDDSDDDFEEIDIDDDEILDALLGSETNTVTVNMGNLNA